MLPNHRAMMRRHVATCLRIMILWLSSMPVGGGHRCWRCVDGRVECSITRCSALSCS